MQKYLIFKRIIDIVFGLTGVFVFFLILPLVALLIKLESKGPVFFFQTEHLYWMAMPYVTHSQ